MPGMRGERVVVFHVAAIDWNCPQYITPRFTEAEWRAREPGAATSDACPG